MPDFGMGVAIAGFTGVDPAPLLDMYFGHVWPRLNAGYRSRVLSDMFDSYGEAAPNGRRAVHKFIERLT